MRNALSRNTAVEPAPAPMSKLGGLIRQERQKRGMTMLQLCEVARISQAFLSLVERGKSTPSLGTLSGIAKALNLPVSAFLELGMPPNAVTRRGERPEFSVADSPVGHERLSTVFPGQNMDALLMRVPPGFRSQRITNVGEEWIYILEGQLTQTVDDTVVTLGPGDTCHFRGDSPHGYENRGRRPVRMLWVGTVSLFGEGPTSR